MKPNEREFQSRRQFLKYGIGAIAGILTLGLAVPLVQYLIAPAVASKKGEWVPIGSADEVQIGKPTLLRYERKIKDKWMSTVESKSAWVWTTDGKKFVVYDPHCTHLGCPYTWTEEGWKGEGPYKGQPHFHCPCHEGIYAIDGTVISGPPPRPLDQLENEVKDGIVLVKEAA